MFRFFFLSFFQQKNFGILILLFVVMNEPTVKGLWMDCEPLKGVK